MKIMLAYPIYEFFSGLGGTIGGHIAHVIGIEQSFRALGNNTVIAAYEEVPCLPKKQFVKLQHTSFNNAKFRKLHVLLKGYKELQRAINLESPDVLYVRSCGLLFLNRVHRMYPEMPIITECSTPSQISMASAFPPVFMKQIGKFADKGFLSASRLVIAVSDQLKSILLEMYPQFPNDKILVVPNGVDCEQFRPSIPSIRDRLSIPEEVFLIGFTGNFAPWHRIDMLIEAMIELPSDIWLILVGVGPKGIMQRLEMYVRKAKLSDRVHFAGAVPFSDMPQYVACFDVAVMPQDKAEPHRSPIKLYEYMAAGKPIVGASVGQIPEVIKDGSNGLLYDSNSVGDLIEKILLVKRDLNLRGKLGNQARTDAISKHSWQNRVAVILSYLESFGR